MTSQFPIEFKRNAVEPVACLKAGWNLVRDQYWLFVGMALVGILIGSVVPFAILLGPMMCGIYLSLFQRQRGDTVEFGTLFKGFDYFGESVVATLFHYIPIIIVVVPFYLVFYIGMFLMMSNQGHGGQVEPANAIGFFALFGVFALIIAAFVTCISVLFTFTYPLIVDRKLSGMDAVKLSVKAGLANFWRLLGLLLLNGVVGVVGALLCYVGLFLVLPVTIAALAIAYEQVFGLGQVQSPRLPPPPPSFA
jgi:uncharacterized membrane protein